MSKPRKKRQPWNPPPAVPATTTPAPAPAPPLSFACPHSPVIAPELAPAPAPPAPEPIGPVGPISPILPPPTAATPAPPIAPVFLSVGNWGDAFCSLGNILAHPLFEPPVHVLHYGKDPEIYHFIAAQPWVGRVTMVQPRDESEYREMVVRLCERDFDPNVESQFLSRLWPDPSALVMTQIGLRYKRGTVNRWTCPRVPAWSLQSMRARLAALPAMTPGTKTYLINPYSFALAKPRDHWPHWPAAIAWMVDQNCRLILVGQTPGSAQRFGGHGETPPLCPPELRAKDPSTLEQQAMFDRLPKDSRILSLVGQTQSANEVLALALLVDGLITTSNNLSMWSVMTRKPAVICLAKVMDDDRYYFRRWVQHPINRLLPSQASLIAFQGAFRDLQVNGANPAAPTPEQELFESALR